MADLNTPKLRRAAREAIESKETKAESVIGRGRPENTFFQLSGRYQGACAVRTAKHGWFAFPWNEDHWGTLRDSDYVLVAAVDDEERPKEIRVHFFKSSTLKSAFDRARASKLEAGLKVSNWTGLWIALHDEPDNPKRSGAAKLAEWAMRIDITKAKDAGSVDTIGSAHAGEKIGITIAEAKALLAAHYGVEAAAIEIVIRG